VPGSANGNANCLSRTSTETLSGISAYHPVGLMYLWNARAIQISTAPNANRLPGGTIAVIAYTHGTEPSIGSVIATQATIASHPVARMIHVQTAVCAAVRMFVLAVLRSLTVRLIASPNGRKRKVVDAVALFVTVADWHRWRVCISRSHGCDISETLAQSRIGNRTSPVTWECQERTRAFCNRSSFPRAIDSMPERDLSELAAQGLDSSFEAGANACGSPNRGNSPPWAGFAPETTAPGPRSRCFAPLPHQTPTHTELEIGS
jgi:hypothetical protein